MVSCSLPCTGVVFPARPLQDCCWLCVCCTTNRVSLLLLKLLIDSSVCKIIIVFSPTDRTTFWAIVLAGVAVAVVLIASYLIFKFRFSNNSVIWWTRDDLKVGHSPQGDHKKTWLLWVIFKGIVHPQAIQDVDEFVNQNRFGEIQHYITCSPVDPLQWMGAVRMRVQAADRNITIIQSIYSSFFNPSIKSFCVFKSFNSKLSLLAKIQYILKG